VLNRVLRFGVKRGFRSIEVRPEDFRRQLADKYGLWVPSFGRMQDVPIERLDAIAESLIRDAQRLAMLGGAGFGLGGMVTLMPDVSLLTAITLRLIQRLCLLYGFEASGLDERVELWLAAATAAGIDWGKDLAERQLFEKAAPRLARGLAAKVGAESAEKWVGRLIPLVSSVIGGAANFAFVRAWGRRAQRNLRAKHLAGRTIAIKPMMSYSPTSPAVN
jgi:uncharacterized protein (DUF697 family)